MKGSHIDLASMLTLVIPTHERPAYLNRLMEYYADALFTLIIVDSSKVKFPFRINNPKVRYIHCPNLDWPAKLLLAANAVDTPYVTMCADDDFVIKNALPVCVEFLEEHPSYQQVLGFMLGFKNYGDHVNFELIYKHAYGFDIKSDSPVQRLESFYKNYVQTFYVVKRKEGYREALLTIQNWKINGKMVDQIISAYSLIKGKMKVLPVFFGVREYIANSNNQSLVSLEDLYQKDEFRPLMDRFFSVTANYLSREGKMPQDKSERIMREIYQAWMINRFHRKRINDFMISSLFGRLLRKIGNCLAFIETLRIYEGYGIVGNGKSKDLSFLNESQDNELKIIKQLIIKHKIKSF